MVDQERRWEETQSPICPRSWLCCYYLLQSWRRISFAEKTETDRYGFLLESCSICERLLEGYYQRWERWSHAADYCHPRRAPQGKSSLLAVCVFLLIVSSYGNTHKMHSSVLEIDPTSTSQACLSGGSKDVYKNHPNFGGGGGERRGGGGEEEGGGNVE